MTEHSGVMHNATSYDFLTWLLSLGRDRALRQEVLRLADLNPGESVLDVGCGTGTLAIAAKRHVGEGSVNGIDASPEMIERARAKAKERNLSVRFEHAAAEVLPFPDASFDVVFSTIMLHHLPATARLQCVSEVSRVLKSGGRFIVVDFHDLPTHMGLLRHLRRHGHDDVKADDVKMEDLIRMLNASGFSIDQSGRFKRNLYFIRALATKLRF